MSRFRLLVVLAAVVALAAAGGLVGALVHRTPDPVADHNFTVGDQLYNCGTSGRVRLEASIGVERPASVFVLDGRRQASTSEPGKTAMVARPVYSCADGRTHHLHITPDYPNPYFAACSVSLLPDVMHRVGYNSADFYGWDNGAVACDVTWTD